MVLDKSKRRLFEGLYQLNDTAKLILSIIIDAIGAASFFFTPIFGIGDAADLIIGPLTALFIWGAYRNLPLSIFAAAEEMAGIGVIDAIPTSVISYFVYKEQKRREQLKSGDVVTADKIRNQNMKTRTKGTSPSSDAEDTLPSQKVGHTSTIEDVPKIISPANAPADNTAADTSDEPSSPDAGNEEPVS